MISTSSEAPACRGIYRAYTVYYYVKVIIAAVPVKKSVTANYVVCLEDGKRQKMLRRHLAVAHGLTPAEYRLKWGLRADHPLVAPNYAKQRSAMAKKIGLGKKRPARKTTKKRYRPAG